MSQRSRPISLPELSILSFDPTAEAADKKKGATGEAARPIGEAMLDTITSRTATPRNIVGNRGDGLDRAYSHAEEWLRQQTERARKEVFSAEFVITPQIAALLLKKNPDNRNLSKKRIAEIRADLERGRYELNGEPIIVSKDGLLNDGQHRLIACVESGVTFRSVVVFGVSRNSRLTLDQGGARTVADYLDMEGETEHTKVAATVSRMLWQHAITGKINGFGMTKGRRNWPTKAEVMQVAKEFDADIQASVAAVQKTSRIIGSLSFIVFCRILLSRADRTMGPVFIDRLLDGANLKPESPIFILRERFINDPKLRQPDRFEALVRAWNAMRSGKPITRIMINGSVPKIEG